MNKLIIVRHGESEQHIRDITGGWSDVSLTEEGFARSVKTGEKLKGLIDDGFKFFSSDLLRAKQTAETIGKTTGIRPVYFSELRELNNGDAANLTKAQAEKIFTKPTEPQLDWVPYPNGESWRMLCNRIHSFLTDNIDTENNYLIVSHGNSIVEIINWYLKVQLIDLHVCYDIDPCSITVLRTNAWNERTINKLNETGHLA